MKPLLSISIHGTLISTWQRIGTSGEGHYRMPNDVKSNPLLGKERLYMHDDDENDDELIMILCISQQPYIGVDIIITLSTVSFVFCSQRFNQQCFFL
jgi:hypothetical protein